MKRGSLLLVVSALLLLAMPARSAGWVLQTSRTVQPLYGVAFSDAGTWVAVGAGGTILRSTDGGIGWAPVSSPLADTLRAVAFNGNIGLTVGLGGAVARTTDGGATWAAEAKPLHKNLYSVSMNAQLAVITGEEGTILVSMDGGVTWVQHFAGTASILFGVSVSGTTGVAVGGQGAITMSPNQGAGWGLTVLGSQLTAFYATSFASTVTGWAVGADPGNGSVILRSDNSGFTWGLQPTPTRNILFGVSFPDLATGTAVGGGGTVIRTTNGGQLWTLQDSGVAPILSAVAFATPAFGIAVGDSGTIIRTTTGGESGPWTDLGFGLVGVSGIPSLVGTGTLAGGSPTSLDLTSANASAPSVLFVGLASNPTSFKGGTLCPIPALLLLTFTTSAAGTVALPFAWPTGLPSGFALDYQFAVQNVAAVNHVALSNALQSLTP